MCPSVVEAKCNPKTVTSDVVLKAENVSVYYGGSIAVKDVTMDIPENQVTALIGPSGCGKSTLIRCFNRLNDLIPSARVEGKVSFCDCDIYQPHVDPSLLRQYIGMVFQKPNPFPTSVYENIAYASRIHGYTEDLDELVENALRRASLWDEVKDKLNESGCSLSGGQQQRLCIARAIAIQPKVLLMDEPCSALDPITTGAIEDMIRELKRQYTIVIVTHNMQQAARISDRAAFFNTDINKKNSRYGYLVEYDLSQRIFSDPREESTRSYVSGEFG